MLRDQFRVGVVDHARNLQLMCSAGEEHVRGRQRDDLYIDSHSIHFFEPLADIGHRWGHAKEARATISDNGLAGRTLPERELGGQIANLVEIVGWIVVSVEVDS